MEDNIVQVESIDDNIAFVESLDDDVTGVTSGERDIFFVKEKFDWLTFADTDWEQSGDEFRLIIPYSTHKCGNPFIDSMLILKSEEFHNNIPTWKVTSADSIVITAFEPVDCKVLIKGDR